MVSIRILTRRSGHGFRTTNKVAIITGGSEGIGKAAAQRMAEEGARVVIVARRPEVLEAAAQDIRRRRPGDGAASPG